ncbi:SphA family protein [Sphingomonas parva]|nr:transporter [Sphingomonas parva]
MSFSLMMMASASVASASEGGGSIYPFGVETILPGYMPPPGWHYFNYTAFVTSDRFNGEDGESVVPEFEFTGLVNAARIVRVWDRKVLGGQLASGATVPVGRVELATPAFRDSRFTIGDPTIIPVALGWHGREVHVWASLDIGVPSGSYEVGRANLSRNAWVIEPNVAVTWFAGPDVVVSAKAVYNHNFENSETDYNSGEELGVEFAADWSVRPDLAIGVGGFVLEQVSDDEQAGVRISSGNRARAKAIGPQVRWSPDGRLQLIAKFQQDFDVRNRSENQTLWLQFYTPLG